MNYIIVTEGRAGSTLLCQHLSQMGVGDPKTYLSELYGKKHTVREFADHLETHRVNGILGLKVSWGILMKIYKDNDIQIGTHEFLNTICPDAKYLYCTRDDRVHQALSRIKHLKMDQSHVRNPEAYQKYRELEEKRLASMSVPTDEILDRIQKNIKGHKAWDIYFSAYDVPVLEVVFEGLIKHRDETLEAISKFLGVPLRLDLLKEGLMATHTGVNDKWHDRIMGGYEKYIA